MTSIVWLAAARVHLIVLMLLVSYHHVLCALVNTTLEETSPQIIYYGNNWVKSDADPSYHGGFHAQTQDTSASAVFNFTGVAIYYYSSLWTKDVTTVLTLDGNNTETLNLTLTNGKTSTKNYTIHWSRTNLKDGAHSLVMSTGNYALVDAIIRSSLHNVTVEETSPQIIHNGDNWINNLSLLYHGGGQSQNQDVNANAMFTFTGNAVYHASLWPFRITTVLSLDGQPGEIVDLTDPSVVPNQETAPQAPTVESSIRWSRTNLTEGNHTLIISPGNYAIVDAITYTQDLSVSTNSSGDSSTTANTERTGLIGVGVVAGILGFLLIIAMVLIGVLFRRLKRYSKSEDQRGEFTARRSIMRQHSGWRRVSPYMMTTPLEVSVDATLHDGLGSGTANATDTTLTARNQTTRKGAYTQHKVLSIVFKVGGNFTR
ncbi:hypothetical protein K435DRAFT_789047 [Dendrothele bispora CBS 962.96]|uniref:Uncharacterized protein n=1 Tax=Dendrothele bispora (strain CBS 962.96) TaxID=1314807 RepID=A0A4S8MVB2_DENBC|nr:hypothetical protein K435DRAFT_789047 [Dendrothele bispora CBS 962.96]